MSACHKCGNELGESDFGRQDTCSKCHFATRCCLNCTFFDRLCYNECSETQADRVVDKEKFNFCDYFKPSHGSGSTDEKPQESPAEKAKRAAEALFKKK